MLLSTLRMFSMKNLRGQIIKASHANSGIFRNCISIQKQCTRIKSTLPPGILPDTSGSFLSSKEESREFVTVFSDIMRDLTEAGSPADIPEVTKWYTKVLQHNVPNGKKSRGLAMVMTYKMLEDPNKLTPENIKLANVMGWCVEMLHAFFLVLDDVMDSAITRRGAPCWYKQEGVGLFAINDSTLIENGIYSILRRYFSNSPIYIPCLELFYDITLKTAMGQALDTMSEHTGKVNLDAFTMSRYNSIAKYKTAFTSFQLPVALGMYLANKFDAEMHKQAKTILVEMARFFQIHDDFLDCYGDPAVTGKIGTDIQEGKCSWLVVVVLEKATPAQKEILRANYGKSDPDSIRTVKNLYEELGLPRTYTIYEEENLNLIRTHIEQISKGLPQKLFFKIFCTFCTKDLLMKMFEVTNREKGIYNFQ